MSDLSVIGTVKSIGEIEEVKENFNICNFVLVREIGSYSQEIAFQLLNEKTELAKNLVVGKEFEVTFDIKCRKNVDERGNEKGYFTNLVAYKIKKV